MDELQNIQNLIYVIRGQRVIYQTFPKGFHVPTYRRGMGTYLITICDDIKD